MANDGCRIPKQAARLGLIERVNCRTPADMRGTDLRRSRDFCDPGDRPSPAASDAAPEQSCKPCAIYVTFVFSKGFGESWNKYRKICFPVLRPGSAGRHHRRAAVLSDRDRAG